jgi:uncharacterized protein (TIGR02646 family)
VARIRARGQIDLVEQDSLPPRLQQLLKSWLAAFEAGDSIKNWPWKAFKEIEKTEAKELLAVLQRMFHHKCAYCETPDANQIEHYWPKSPHPTLNNNLGTPKKMFVWNNFLLSCQKCNGWEYKGASMKFDCGRPRLLNPCVDDPLCYFKISLEISSAENAGQIKPALDLSDDARRRAEYTAHKLGLNKRVALRNGRKRTIRQFLIFMQGLLEEGAERELLPGYTIRQGLLDVLQPSEPYLAPVRQLLHEQPEIKRQLLTQIPELEEVINKWALPPVKCKRGTGTELPQIC